jgi:hypothetical protein
VEPSTADSHSAAQVRQQQELLAVQGQ